MPEKNNFEALVNRLRTGDEEAAARVFDHFAERLIARAQAHLHDGLRQKVDPEDVVQSVFRTFFRRHREGQLEIDSWESMWGILTVITLRKCGHCTDYFHAARRDIRREVTARPEGDSTCVCKAIARDPTPTETAALVETVEQLMHGLEAHDADIVSLHLQGYTISEVCTHVGYSERTVGRTLERIRKRLHRMQVDEQESS